MKNLSQNDKLLLIKDLSARLPYAVIVEHISGFRGTLHDITVHHMYDDNDNIHDAICYTDFFGDEDSIYIEYFKPYLFPISSMSEEERITIGNEFAYGQPHKAMDVLHKKHIDYRGLIEKGLAIDATNLNIY